MGLVVFVFVVFVVSVIVGHNHTSRSNRVSSGDQFKKKKSKIGAFLKEICPFSHKVFFAEKLQRRVKKCTVLPLDFT